MKLSNPFPDEVRLLYAYTHACISCGRNGSDSGGLELNHIFGRVSDSAFNASLLCRECHSHVGHSEKEHAQLFFLNAKYLLEIMYIASEKDKEFIDKYVMPIYPLIRSLW